MSPLRWGSVTLLCFGFVFLDSAGETWGVIAVYFSSLKILSWAGSFIFAGLLHCKYYNTNQQNSYYLYGGTPAIISEYAFSDSWSTLWDKLVIDNVLVGPTIVLLGPDLMVTIV